VPGLVPLGVDLKVVIRLLGSRREHGGVVGDVEVRSLQRNVTRRRVLEGFEQFSDCFALCAKDKKHFRDETQAQALPVARMNRNRKLRFESNRLDSYTLLSIHSKEEARRNLVRGMFHFLL